MYLILLAFAIFGFAWCVRSMFRARQPRVLPRAVFGSLTLPMSRMLPISQRGRRDLAKDLRRAGSVHSTALENFLATRNAVLAAWLFFTVGLLATGLLEFGPWWIWPSILGCILIVGLPRIFVSLRSGERAKTIGQELPDTLDFLAMMMSGGMTMQQSLNHVVDEFDDTHPALSMELKLLARQSETGTLDHALHAFAERLDLPEITALRVRCCAVAIESVIRWSNRCEVSPMACVRHAMRKLVNVAIRLPSSCSCRSCSAWHRRSISCCSGQHSSS